MKTNEHTDSEATILGNWRRALISLSVLYTLANAEPFLLDVKKLLQIIKVNRFNGVNLLNRRLMTFRSWITEDKKLQNYYKT